MRLPLRTIRKIILLLLVLILIQIAFNYTQFYESVANNDFVKHKLSFYEPKTSEKILTLSKSVNYFCSNRTIIDIFDEEALDYLNYSKAIQKPKYDRCNLTDERQRTFLKLEDVSEKFKKRFNNSELYKVELDYDYILDVTNSTATKDVACYLQQFVKKIAMNKDKEPILIEPKYYFTSENNYEIQLSQHGFYYFQCQNASSNEDEDEFVFRDLLTILPWNLSKLVDRANQYDHLIKETVANYTDSKTNPVFSDIEYTECLKEGDGVDSEHQPKINMFLHMLDSVSYEQFARTFPVTFKYLSEELDHNVLFSAVNRVGEKTYPNFLAMTAGIIEHDIDNEFTVYKKIDYKWFDTLPLIWKDYKELGYFTMYLQENPKIGPFHYNKKGFK
jgi:hypothetical protein